MRWRQPYMSRSKLMMVLRLTLGGITAAAPRSSSSALSQSASNALSPSRAPKAMPEQRPHADNVVMLAGQQDEAHKGAEGVDKGDDLGRQAAARAADGLGPGPPLYGAHYVKRYLLRANAVCWTKSGPASLLSGRRLAAPPCIRSALEGVLTNIPRSWA